ncbi:hypothetical protein C8A00DRAFT_19408, partial [Chaetomidium leptoderma]
ANQLLNAMDDLSRPIRLNYYLTKQRLVDARFVDIEKGIRLPLNSRFEEAPGRDLGRWFNLGLQQACQPLSLAPLSRRRYGWSPDKIDDLPKRSGPSFTAILCMHTAHYEFDYTCELPFIDCSFCVGQNLADWSQAYFHSQKATVNSAFGGHPPEVAARRLSSGLAAHSVRVCACKQWRKAGVGR